MKFAALLLLVTMLAGCGGGDSGPGGVTAEESRALDDAAAMIDSQRLPPEALATPSPETPATPGGTGAP